MHFKISPSVDYQLMITKLDQHKENNSPFAISIAQNILSRVLNDSLQTEIHSLSLEKKTACGQAYFYLADCYKIGIGACQQNLVKAKEHYEKAKLCDHPEASARIQQLDSEDNRNYKFNST